MFKTKETKRWTSSLTFGYAGQISEADKERFESIWAGINLMNGNALRRSQNDNIVRLLQAYVGTPYFNRLGFRHHITEINAIINRFDPNASSDPYDFFDVVFDLLKLTFLPDFNPDGALSFIIDMITYKMRMEKTKYDTVLDQVRDAYACEKASELLKTYNQRGFLHPNRHFGSQVADIIRDVVESRDSSEEILARVDAVLSKESGTNPTGELALIRQKIVDEFTRIGIFTSAEPAPTLTLK